MSAVPAAVWRAGTENVYVGSSTDMVGLRHSPAVPHFSFLVISDITANASISEPVAERVRTEKIGSASLMSSGLITRSHASPSYFAPAATTLAQSMVEPPPMARTIWMSFWWQSSTPRRTVWMRGLGSTPESSNTWTPASLRMESAWS